MVSDVPTPTNWQELMDVTRDQRIVIERVRVGDKNIYIEGSFELPPFARLNPEDQVFVAAFIKCHGSIKEMEKIFGVSYPTIKSALNRIASSFELIDTEKTVAQTEILNRLDRGEISAEEAIRALEALK